MTARSVVACVVSAVCGVMLASPAAVSAHHQQVCGLYAQYPPPTAGVADCDPAAFWEAPRGSLRNAGNGIWVHRSIAHDVRALLAAAAADGHTGITGEGFRTYEDQLRLRSAHCGDTEHGLYLMAAVECSPPTSRPGRSMHQKGLAIDFTVNRKLLTAADPLYAWLTLNAHRFGLHNFPLEPWHWSTNGR